jgi:hypothetical protein
MTTLYSRTPWSVVAVVLAVLLGSSAAEAGRRFKATPKKAGSHAALRAREHLVTGKRAELLRNRAQQRVVNRKTHARH